MSDGNQVDINDERSVRLERLEELKEKGRSAYASGADRTHTNKEALGVDLETEMTIVGRVTAKRDFGKIAFADVRDESGEIQIVFKLDEVDDEVMEDFSELVDIGDILQVSGERFKTQKDEDSVLVGDWKMLSKSLRPMPDKHYGLEDKETRLRKRYLDFLAHPKLKDLFRKKSKFWREVRNFMIDEDFLEVETPVLEPTPGGADAEPFVTHHNALDMDVYMRISMGELWQKRLMVGGYEKTFELGRQFRNEGMSREHLQDYTQMEFYWAYADYEDSMDLVEEMYKQVIKNTWDTLQFDINGFGNVDLSKDWKKIDFVETVEEMQNINILEASKEELQEKLDELGVEYEDFEGRGRLMDSIWKQCRKEIKGPCFLINHPVEVSPLAKRKENNPKLTERYQIIFAGSEMGNGYTELNNPIDQAERFEEQAKLREQGDEEAQMHDEDFVEALEHGMPPTTGFGMSERVFSFMEDRPIRECVMFPLVRRKEKQDNQG